MSGAALHAVVVVAILATYLVLTLTGQDGNPVLALLGGHALGTAVEKVKTTTS